MIADVIGVGARGPMGLSSRQLALCIRARKFEPRTVRVRDKRDNEIGVAFCGGLGETLYGFPRIVRLAAPSLSEATAALEPSLAPTEELPLPVLLCLPQRGRPDDERRFDEQAISAISEHAGIAVDLNKSEVFRQGRAGFAHALERAKTLLDSGVKRVAVGGVDSYYHPDVLTWLDSEFRLKALGAEDGFIPSEASAFLILSRGAKSAGAIGRILDAASGLEPNHDGEEHANLGVGMSNLISESAARVGPVPWALVDLNGERYRTREWGMASVRVLSHCEETRLVWDTGDVGAASGPIFSVVALMWQHLGCAVATRAVVALHSDGPERGVVVLEGNDDGA